MHYEDSLTKLLDVEQLEHNWFRGEPSKDTVRRQVFGGQVAAQALAAALRTVEDRAAHSLHSYFLRPGDPQLPIVYDVDRIRDGKSFTTRRVVAIQRGEAIFNMAASFQVLESGFAHQTRMPDVPPPERCETHAERVQALAARYPRYAPYLDGRERPIIQRYVNSFVGEPHDQPLMVWIRSRDPLPADPALHQAVLTYTSDLMLLNNALVRHGSSWFDPNLMCASLDHAVWFHRVTDMNRWHLYVQHSPVAAHARGLNFGEIFREDGSLVASVVQEGLMRKVERDGA
jgi:acyl-CoA thioesterase-2